MREYIATAMRLGAVPDGRGAQEHVAAEGQSRRRDDEIHRACAGPGAWGWRGWKNRGCALEESRLCPQPSAAEKGEGRADVPLLDDVVGYAPALLLSEGSQDDALAQRSAEQQQQWPRHLHNRRRVRTPTPHLSVAF